MGYNINEEYIIHFLSCNNKIIIKNLYNFETLDKMIFTKMNNKWYLIKNNKTFIEDSLYKLIIKNLNNIEICKLNLDSFASIKNNSLFFPFFL